MSSYVIGFGASVIAAIAFGSNFVPVKQYEMGDGMLFQLYLCAGIWMFGVVYQIIRATVLGHGPYFNSFAIVGGIIWTTGNICTVPIIKCIGMALGLAIWGGTALLVGWCTGKFGLLGTPKDDSVNNAVLNYIGVILTIIAVVLFSQIQPTKKNSKRKKSSKITINENVDEFLIKEKEDNTNNKSNEDENEDEGVSLPKVKPYIFNPLPSNNSSTTLIFDKRKEIIDKAKDPYLKEHYEREQQEAESFVDHLSSTQRQLVGVGLSVFAGFCYGLVFCPINYVMKTHKGGTQHSNDYALCHYTGILFTSLLYFFLYAAHTKNQPHIISQQAVVPSFFSGIVWSVAQTCFFIADSTLGTETAFPIVSSSPQIVASLWGILVYKEITDTKQRIQLVTAIAINVAGVLCIAFSSA